jgi:hypothetical protein
MIELTKVDRENKVYVNDKVIILDKNTITASELLELAGFSSLVYDICLVRNQEKKNKNINKANKPLEENKKLKIETGMRFDASLKQN